MLDLGEKIPSTGGSEDCQTCDIASYRTASLTHYQLHYSGSLIKKKINEGTERHLSSYYSLLVGELTPHAN